MEVTAWSCMYLSLSRWGWNVCNSWKNGTEACIICFTELFAWAAAGSCWLFNCCSLCFWLSECWGLPRRGQWAELCSESLIWLLSTNRRGLTVLCCCWLVRQFSALNSSWSHSCCPSFWHWFRAPDTWCTDSHWDKCSFSPWFRVCSVRLMSWLEACHCPSRICDVELLSLDNTPKKHEESQKWISRENNCKLTTRKE